jgi:AcrR family transcriptional regulator
VTDPAAPDASSRLPWWPEPRDRTGDREPLTRAQIVDAAIRLIDADGIEGFSMRKLAQELGAGATTLYWHVRDKDQLIDLVMDQITGEVELVDDPAQPWRERTIVLATALRAVLRRHRHLAVVFGARMNLGPNMLNGIELLLAVLREAGFEKTRLTLAFSAVMNYALGTAVLEGRGISGPGTEGKSADEIQLLFAQRLMSLPPAAYPNLVNVIPDSNYDEITEDAQFAWGLERLLDGLEAELAKA